MDVAVDYVQADERASPAKSTRPSYGDGLATRMIVPRCPELDLGRGRGFSIEGWINPSNVTNAGPAGGMV